MIEIGSIIQLIVYVLLAATLVTALVRTFFTVGQNNVAVITRFGKFNGIRPAGLNTKVPFLDKYKPYSLANISVNLDFKAITKDQANVFFKTMFIISALDATADTMKKIAFTFVNKDAFSQALNKTVEGMVRSFIAGKNQSEILELRAEITEYVKKHIETTLAEWGYKLHDIQVNDIAFDEIIMESMAQVVASSNKKAAATNEGAAVLIQKTKLAEANGAQITIEAQAEKTAAKLRGEGVADFRKAVSEGLKGSIDELKMDNNQDAIKLITFSMWMDGIKHFAEYGKGNFINLDGSPEGMKRSFESLMSLSLTGNIPKNGNTPNGKPSPVISES